ncbi:NB-ARC and TPR domain-containing protein [Colletotrichum musicola]|uniref:NB-ARC and TPR domain-containing protein n=1 Tax=Colletotrichum musicola TaxID=2175873 RepID=A0A8H6N8B4_9PEZI|nr:NB-ARC and TPR domain-containing protein [Colletotrichum musicola]
MEGLIREIGRQIGADDYGDGNKPHLSADLLNWDGVLTFHKRLPAGYGIALDGLHRLICALSQPTPYFFDPEEIIRRSEAIQVSRAARGSSAVNSDDIWLHKSLERWVSSQAPHLLALLGQYGARHRLERSGLEITKFLQKACPTLFLLQPFMKSTDNEFGNMKPEQILRQLSIQALRNIFEAVPISLLSAVLEKFQKAVSLDDWVQVFRFTFLRLGQRRQVYVVLDLSIAGNNIEVMDSLVAALHHLLGWLQSEPSSVVLKIMVLTSRRMSIPSTEQTSSIVIGQPKDLPRHPAKLMSAKQRLTKLLEEQVKLALDAQSSECGANRTTSISNSGPFDGPSGQTPTHQRANTDFDSNPSQSTAYGRGTQPHTYQRPTGRMTPNLPSSEANSSNSATIRDSVTVAIVCALRLEADAARALFDDHWDDDVAASLITPGDTNAYSMGRVGRHNVVLIHMAGMGKSSAATAAAYCKSSFPKVALALLVGVCGGVPSAKGAGGSDIVLGDVVVSEGVVSFDFGRRYPDFLVRKDSMMDSLGRPTPAVRAFLAKLQTRLDRRWLDEKIADYLAQLARDFGDEVVYPGASEDRLFEGSYRHKHRASSGCSECNTDLNSVCDAARTASCEVLGCDDTRLVSRARLERQTELLRPEVHFGLVASGDQVMKSGEHRDKIAAMEGVVAFEMEAAGAWDHFSNSCVVIKGVCDYADSHKNKRWHRYAAATAAACMRAFLDKWSFRS